MKKYKKIIGIYCIENLISGKKYIGASTNIMSRFDDHYYDLIEQNHNDSREFEDEWVIYGKNNFSFYIIEECLIDELFEREVYWIKYYNTTDQTHGYNKSVGGNGPNGFSHTQETRIKMSNSKKGVKFSQEHKNNLSLSLIGKRKNGIICKSKYIGISYKKRESRWHVRINPLDQKRITIGYSINEIEAALMYNEAMLECYGWKVKDKLNIITQDEIKKLWDDQI
jgi:group I intron endonuclease